MQIPLTTIDRSEQARLLSQNLGFLDENFVNDYPDIF